MLHVVIKCCARLLATTNIFRSSRWPCTWTTNTNADGSHLEQAADGVPCLMAVAAGRILQHHIGAQHHHIQICTWKGQPSSLHASDRGDQYRSRLCSWCIMFGSHTLTDPTLSGSPANRRASLWTAARPAVQLPVRLQGPAAPQQPQRALAPPAGRLANQPVHISVWILPSHGVSDPKVIGSA
jgi:hypothetical protein